MDELEELYDNLKDIFENDYFLYRAVKEDLFSQDYIKVYVLVLKYFNLVDIPINILELCIDGELEYKEYEEIYTFLSNKWENNAKTEIEDIIEKIEKGEDIL